MEIPTYPYDQEYKGLPFVYQRILFIDKCFRQHLARYVDKIVTFSDYDIIWNRPTIRISNGINFIGIVSASFPQGFALPKSISAVASPVASPQR